MAAASQPSLFDKMANAVKRFVGQAPADGASSQSTSSSSFMQSASVKSLKGLHIGDKPAVSVVPVRVMDKKWLQSLTGSEDSIVHTINIQSGLKLQALPDEAEAFVVGQHWNNIATRVKRRTAQEAQNVAMNEYRRLWRAKKHVYWTNPEYKAKYDADFVAAYKKENPYSSLGSIDNIAFADNMPKKEDFLRGLPEVLFVTERFSGTHSTRACAFYMALYQTYANHGEVLLTPDDVWLMIQLSFSRYVNLCPENAERLRPLLVHHDGKKVIEIKVPAPVGVIANQRYTNLPWSLFCESVLEEMRPLMKNEAPEKLLADFSTTTAYERLVSSVVVMDSFKAYFDYVMRLSCGITKVHMGGTLEDWEKLEVKLAALRIFDEPEPKTESEREEREKQKQTRWSDETWSGYIDRLAPVLTKLTETFRGNVDVDWWNRVIDEKHAQGYGFGTSSLTGWATSFIFGIPKEPEDLQDIGDVFARCPVTINDHGQMIETEMLAGFDGLTVFEGRVIRPHTSVAVFAK